MRTGFIFFLLLSNPSFAAVIVPGPNADEREYKAMLQVHPDHLSPSQKLLHQRPGAREREDLLKSLAEAQEAFLNQSFGAARESFLKVARSAFSEDWRSEQIDIIVYALLRLAQLEGDAEKARPWLQKAADLGSPRISDSSLFPPPLLAQFMELRRQNAPLQIPNEVFKEWPIILVNGQSCSAGACDSRPSGQARVTWLSDRWLPVTTLINSKDIAAYHPRQEPWVRGACSNPIAHAQTASLGEVRFFWNLDCEAAPQKKINLQPTSEPSPSEAFIKPGLIPTQLENKWLWAGVGLGALALTLILNGQSHSVRSAPTTTYE